MNHLSLGNTQHHIHSITGASLDVTTSGSIISGTTFSNIFQANNTNIYRNKIEMSNLWINPSVQSTDIRTQYFGIAHPSNSLSATANYGFFQAFTGGDIALAINNVTGYVFSTDWGNRKIYNDYTIQSQKMDFYLVIGIIYLRIVVLRLVL